MRKKIIFILTGLFIVTVIIYRDLIAYGIGQAKGQIKVVRNTVPLEEVLNDPLYPDSLKRKIRLIMAVRLFAIGSIGLTNSDSYTTFYDQEGKVLLWNLSACKPFEFTPKTWSFPFIGTFPYKGFFDLEKAKTEKKQLDDQNYDARIRAVGGWSTLGWFKDPVLSKMLKRSDGKLADLIIHELTHATLFVKNNITFNENLASFIGEKGAELFLLETQGAGSDLLMDYQLQLEDEKCFSKFMLSSYALLDSLYQSLPYDFTDSVKSIEKHFLMDDIIASLDTISFHDPRYARIFDGSRRPNNAHFMSFQRYHSVEDSLNTILKNEYGSDLHSFIKGMKEYYE